jgi:hypothetical protein
LQAVQLVTLAPLLLAAGVTGLLRRYFPVPVPSLRNLRELSTSFVFSTLLAQLAHNLLIWARRALADAWPAVESWGILRLVRDLMAIPGEVELDAQGHLLQITLNRNHPWALPFVQACVACFKHGGLTLSCCQI